MKNYAQSDHNLAHFKSPRQAKLYLLKYHLNVMVVKQDLLFLKNWSQPAVAR